LRLLWPRFANGESAASESSAVTGVNDSDCDAGSNHPTTTAAESCRNFKKSLPSLSIWLLAARPIGRVKRRSHILLALQAHRATKAHQGVCHAIHGHR
jgi:hypothetical protein